MASKPGEDSSRITSKGSYLYVIKRILPSVEIKGARLKYSEDKFNELPDKIVSCQKRVLTYVPTEEENDSNVSPIEE